MSTVFFLYLFVNGIMDYVVFSLLPCTFSGCVCVFERVSGCIYSFFSAFAFLILVKNVMEMVMVMEIGI